MSNNDILLGSKVTDVHIVFSMVIAVWTLHLFLPPPPPPPCFPAMVEMALCKSDGVMSVGNVTRQRGKEPVPISPGRGWGGGRSRPGQEGGRKAYEAEERRALRLVLVCLADAQEHSGLPA